ncbi:MAG TPA: hypothetical protein VHF08_04745 [Nitrososphaeraceae archaeon]|nr:hypothetical protein [Nitrososphaeraceae archaeon]
MTGLIITLFASDTRSLKSFKVPVYDPISLYALVGNVIRFNFNSPPNNPTGTTLTLLLSIFISVSTVLDKFTKSITASGPVLSVNSITVITGSSFL